MTEAFGTLPDGREAGLHRLENDHLRVAVTDFGGRTVSIQARDRAGAWRETLLGLDDAGAYARAGGSFGAILGRCANRIAGGRFTLDGQVHQLATNDDGSTRHGGPVGFGLALWRVTGAGGATPELALAHRSPDGDQGFPGALSARATYRLAGDTLILTLEAETDAPTPVNLSHHPYFNFAGVARADVLGHEVTVRAGRFLPTDAAQIPTGEEREVADTPFDFRAPRRLEEGIRGNDPQLLLARGYDHCLVLDGGVASEPRPVARVRDPASGRGVEIGTDQPGLQLYSGNSLDGAVVGRGGVAFRQSAGLAVEAQGFPDAPNRPGFPSVILRPGERWRRVIWYRFFG